MKLLASIRDFFSPPKKSIEITIENKKMVQFRRMVRGVNKFCPYCQNKTLFLTLEDVQAILQADEKALEILLAVGDLHFSRSFENDEENKQLVCSNSINLINE